MPRRSIPLVPHARRAGTGQAGEEALLGVNKTLEQSVTERTTELQSALDALEAETAERNQAEDTLRQSQKMEAVGQLTGGVAHDFNNLLTAVMGNLGLLRKRLPDDPRAQRLLEGAMQGAERGSALTQRMLAFARQQELTPRSAEMASLLVGMGDLLERTLGPRIALSLQTPAGLPTAQVDTNQIELAILNLAINAVPIEWPRAFNKPICSLSSSYKCE